MLYRHDIPGPGPDAEHQVASLDNIQFSPDGKLVYFEATRWATSSDLWVMDEDGKNRRTLGPANVTRIVQSSAAGDYRGFIVASQHRYFVFGGSYDWYYLFTPCMEKEIGPISEERAEGIEGKSVTFVPTYRLESCSSRHGLKGR